LNVKAFLAGKRGVCPQCGAGLDIPLESQITKGEKSEKKQAAKPLGRDKTESVGSEDLMAVPVSSPASVDDVPAAPGRPQPSVPTSNASTAQAAAVAPVASVAAATSPPASAHGAIPVQPVTPVTPVAMPIPAAPVDPIEESPESSWYVRPPSGGQYGPARGEIMRKWITEGRVSADSLVWREGWDDWLTASDVFPSLGSVAMPPVPGPAPAPAPYAPVSPTPTHSTSSIRPRRRNSSAQAVTIVVMLGLVVVALVITLFFVMSS